jgi:hypothetical protein
VAVAVLAVAEAVALDGDGEADRDDEAEPDGDDVVDDFEPVGEGETELDLVGSVLGLGDEE